MKEYMRGLSYRIHRDYSCSVSPVAASTLLSEGWMIAIGKVTDQALI
ncbi:MAG: hypothetical protein OEW69_09295 [Nitrospirota bacterium]|nr:hypothetical protein [Nitrospirota bacterium]